MSLLLDALQRASKEKEKLAEARVPAEKPVQATEPVAHGHFPPLTIDFGNNGPDLSSAPETAATQPGLSADGETVRGELTLDPLETLPAETWSPPEFPAVEHAPDLPLRDAAETSGIALPGKLEPPPESAAVRPTPAAPAPSLVNAAKLASQAAPDHPSPVISPKVAREILEATAKTLKKGPNRRLIAMGSVALLIAGANAAFFLGFMDKFLGISGPGLAPPVSPSTMAMQVLPPSAPAQAAASEAQGDSDSTAAQNVKADEAVPAAKAASIGGPAGRTGSRRQDSSVPAPRQEQRRTSASVPSARAASRATGEKIMVPVFVAKPAAASALDTAYGALTEGRLDDAVKDYRQALEKNPGERDAFLGLAYIAQRQGDREEARAYYQQILRQDPTHPGANAGMLTLAAESDLQMTASRAREMAERSPDSAVVLSTLGGILAKEGRIGEAQQSYFRALTLEPDNAFHAYNLAVALDHLHKYAQAQVYYQRALALAEKSGAGERASFPHKAALQRLEQLREQSP